MKKTFKSKFEQQCSKELEKRGYKYEVEKIKYKIPESEHTYTPDFSRPEGRPSKDKSKTVYEIKGRMRNKAECDKYVHIRDSNPSLCIVFVLQNPRCPMPGAKRRRDGTIYTVSDWCDRNGFRWITLSTLHELNE